MKISIINTTTDSDKIARQIAECLIKNKLSPCVQIVPQIESIYQWQKQLKYSNEFLLIIKTLPQHVHECKEHILELHNYDIPEIIVTQGKTLQDEYSEWFLNTTTQ